MPSKRTRWAQPPVRARGSGPLRSRTACTSGVPLARPTCGGHAGTGGAYLLAGLCRGRHTSSAGGTPTGSADRSAHASPGPGRTCYGGHRIRVAPATSNGEKGTPRLWTARDVPSPQGPGNVPAGGTSDPGSRRSFLAFPRWTRSCGDSRYPSPGHPSAVVRRAPPAALGPGGSWPVPPASWACAAPGGAAARADWGGSADGRPPVRTSRGHPVSQERRGPVAAVAPERRSSGSRALAIHVSGPSPATDRRRPRDG